jgi:hypothetical protein
MYHNDIESLRDYHLRMENEWESHAWQMYKAKHAWVQRISEWMAKYHKKQAAKHRQPFRLG